MNFFEEQDRRRKRTRTLILAFGLALLVVDVVVYLVCAWTVFWFHYHLTALDGSPGFSWWNGKLFVGVSVVVSALIVLQSVRMRRRLAEGGGALAVRLAGDLVLENPTDPGEKRVLNIVEEMAIASSLPVPLVFVLNRQNGINAFAAGYGPSDAVIGVTKGCVDLLTREELEGVVAHEFAHIRNGDMGLNLRMVCILHGLLGLHTAGKFVMRGPGPLPVAGTAICVVGWLGVFLGKLIRLAVSRQCEYGADAAAVQFTRNPAGIAGALRKIGGGGGSRVRHPYAETMDHLFFAEGVGGSWPGLLSSHPPLVNRIRQIEPWFDGVFPRVVSPAAVESRPPRFAPENRIPVIPSIPEGEAVARIGTLGPAHLAYAGFFLFGLDARLRAATRDPSRAELLVYSLLLDRDPAKREIQVGRLAGGLPQSAETDLNDLFGRVENEAPGVRISLLDLAIPTLRRADEERKRTILANVEVLTRSDKCLDVFEFTVEKILKRALGSPAARTIQYVAMKPLLPDAEVLLSLIAYAGQRDPEAAKSAFAKVGHSLGPWGLGMVPREGCSFDRVERALDRLSVAAPRLKRQILGAATLCAAADGEVTVKESELLRSVAAALDTPIPDLLLPVFPSAHS